MTALFEGLTHWHWLGLGFVLLAIEVPYPVLVLPLQELARQFPYLDVTIRHPMDGDVSVLVQQGEVDLGIAFSQPAYPRGVAFRQNGGQFIIADASQDKMLAADLLEHMRQRQQ